LLGNTGVCCDQFSHAHYRRLRRFYLLNFIENVRAVSIQIRGRCFRPAAGQPLLVSSWPENIWPLTQCAVSGCNHSYRSRSTYLFPQVITVEIAKCLVKLASCVIPYPVYMAVRPSVLCVILPHRRDTRKWSNDYWTRTRTRTSYTQAYLSSARTLYFSETNSPQKSVTAFNMQIPPIWS